MKKQQKSVFLKQELKNSGIEVEIPESYKNLEERSLEKIRTSLSLKPKARRLFEMLESDCEVRANWDMADFLAVAKLNYNDHGEVHAKVTTASALAMLELLIQHKIPLDLIQASGGDLDDEFLVIVAASLLHDIGNQIHRENHSLHSVILSVPILDRLLPEIYAESEKRTEIRGFILHAIYAHEAEVRDLTTEAALVGIADATDMTKGRGRMAFDLGNVNIHCVSALAIDEVTIAEGKESPIEILIQMSNSAGIFQVQETLGRKVIGSPLESYIKIVAYTAPAEILLDKRVVHRIYLEGKVFRQGKLIPP